MFIPFIIKILYIYLIGFVLAVLEIQIEGKHGWAEKLPAWRPHPESKLAKWYSRLFSQKDFTGYHFFLNIFLLLMFHLPFVWFMNWTWQAELELLAFFALFVVVWDFLWFVLNPHYSLHDFGPKQVWWHKKWLGQLPVDYTYSLLLVIILFLPLLAINPYLYLLKLLILLVVNLILIILTIWLYPKAY